MKTKISISIDADVLRKAEKMVKLMREPNLSKYIQHVLEHYNSDPEELVKAKIREHQLFLSVFSEILGDIEAMRSEEPQEERILSC